MKKKEFNKNYYLGIIDGEIVAITDDIGKERILRDSGIGYSIVFNPGYPRGDWSMILSKHDFHHARQRFERFIDSVNKFKYGIDSSYTDALDLESIKKVYTKIKRISSNEKMNTIIW
jgi:hypothetical protein